MKIPYGVADFHSLRAEGQLYVDRTGYVRTLDGAETQAKAYRGALERRHGEVLKLRAYAVVALGFARIIVRPLA